LIETDADVEKLEKVVEGLEGKLAAAKKELEQEKAKAAVVVKTKPEEKGDGTVGKQKQRDDWW
jgi:hypothetical protein